jgi:hypothetical protein
MRTWPSVLYAKLTIAGVAFVIATATTWANYCEQTTGRQLQSALAADHLSTGLLKYLQAKMSRPRYFEGDPERDCTEYRTDHPLYPGIPMRDCTYEYLGLTGWVRLANPTPEIATRWIVNACAEMEKRRQCVLRLTAYTWCSNQLSFPVTGNIIEDASSAGGSGSAGVNLAFVHGVTISRPAWMPERMPVDVGAQRDKLGPLAEHEGSYRGGVAQVSRPSGIRREIYEKYAAKLKIAGKEIEVGKSCPKSARNLEWLRVSRESFLEGWQSGQHRLFNAAAKALMRGVSPGAVKC